MQAGTRTHWRLAWVVRRLVSEDHLVALEVLGAELEFHHVAVKGEVRQVHPILDLLFGKRSNQCAAHSNQRATGGEVHIHGRSSYEEAWVSVPWRGNAGCT
jgi:hypothetical protein